MKGFIHTLSVWFLTRGTDCVQCNYPHAFSSWDAIQPEVLCSEHIASLGAEHEKRIEFYEARGRTMKVTELDLVALALHHLYRRQWYQFRAFVGEHVCLNCRIPGYFWQRHLLCEKCEQGTAWDIYDSRRHGELFEERQGLISYAFSSVLHKLRSRLFNLGLLRSF